MASSPKMSFAVVARQVINEQVRPSRGLSRGPAVLQTNNLHALVRALLPLKSQKDWLRIFVDLLLCVLLCLVSAIHVYHGALLFHEVVVNTKIHSGRVCASSSFHVDPSAIGMIDPQFCPNLQLVQPAMSCSGFSSDVADAKVNALFSLPDRMFFVAQNCESDNSNISTQCKAFLASSLSPDNEKVQSKSEFPSLTFQHLSKICSTSLAHIATSANEKSIEITSMISTTPSIILPTSVFPFCSCDAAWAIISLDGKGAGTAAKFLLQDPPIDASAVEILDGPEAAASNCQKNYLGSACALPIAVRTPLGNGCACLQWIHFQSKFWWLLLVLQMTAAATVWLREGTALILPLIAYRDMATVCLMSSSLPCALATAVWRPHLLSQPSSLTFSRTHRADFRNRWLHHFQIFTLAQHLPMFIGSYFFAHVISMTDDTHLQKLPSLELAAITAVAGWGLR
jgi:hypothetical protein